MLLSWSGNRLKIWTPLTPNDLSLAFLTLVGAALTTLLGTAYLPLLLISLAAKWIRLPVIGITGDLGSIIRSQSKWIANLSFAYLFIYSKSMSNHFMDYAQLSLTWRTWPPYLLHVRLLLAPSSPISFIILVTCKGGKWKERWGKERREGKGKEGGEK